MRCTRARKYVGGTSFKFRTCCITFSPLFWLLFSLWDQVAGLKELLAVATVAAQATNSVNKTKEAEKIAERLARNETKLSAAEKRFKFVANMINSDLKVGEHYYF